MPSLLIQNGTVLDPSRVFERRADVLIRDGKIAAVGLNLGSADRVIDAAGKYVTGFVFFASFFAPSRLRG